MKSDRALREGFQFFQQDWCADAHALEALQAGELQDCGDLFLRRAGLQRATDVSRRPGAYRCAHEASSAMRISSTVLVSRAPEIAGAMAIAITFSVHAGVELGEGFPAGVPVSAGVPPGVDPGRHGVSAASSISSTVASP